MAQNSSKSGSVIAPMILPASAVLVLYGMVYCMVLQPGWKELGEAQQRLNQLQASPVSWPQVEQARSELAQHTEELESAQALLAQTQREAQTYGGKQIAAADQLDTMGSLDDLLRRHGLTITADHNLQGRGQMQLASSLNAANRALLEELEKSHQLPAGSKARYIPADLPRDVSPDEYFESLNQGPGRGRLPEVQFREVEVIGSYSNLLAALDQLEEYCGNSLVIGVAFRRPASRNQEHNLRVWTLQLQVRPNPEDLPAETTDPEPVQLAADSTR